MLLAGTLSTAKPRPKSIQREVACPGRSLKVVAGIGEAIRLDSQCENIYHATCRAGTRRARLHATCSPRNSVADLHRDHLHERLSAVFGTAHVRQDGAADARRSTGGLGGLVVLYSSDAGCGVWLRASAGALSRPEIGAGVSPCPPGPGTCGAPDRSARNIGGRCAGPG